ncbi:MAG: glycosyltransferase [Candidatus Hodarchaeales archaeon]|jgi:cellulose synthase/poly-beta-1,6-N-acetylglucosamine synthase-like glycosyltransferase
MVFSTSKDWSSYFGRLLITFGVGLVGPLIIVVATFVLSLIFPGLVIDSTFLTLYFFSGCTLYNIFLLVVLSRARIKKGEDIGHFFSLLIPAHNEESVLGETLERVLNLDYPSELYEVIVVNDGSVDKTERVARRFQQKHPNLKVLRNPYHNGGRGKSAALNIGFADFLLTWRGLEIKPRHRWIIGVFDSDAIPKSDILKKASFQFNDQKVGGVQTLVRIKNAKRSFLAKLQDIEFLAFARVMQFARTSYSGAVALGGNGQFVRATALDAVALKQEEEYWNQDSLTEDLEMGIRLLTNKWKNVYIDSTYVSQEGTETLYSMFRQRERWAWGTLQTLKWFVFRPSFWRKKFSLRTKLDISVYLIHVLIPILVFLCWAWSGLAILGIIGVSNFFPFAFMVVNAFSFIPLFAYGLLKQRAEYPRWQIVPLIFIAAAYTYHWIPVVMSAIVKILTTKPKWTKTPRFNSL